MDAYQQYIHKSRYARYIPEEQRRETWEETVNRYLDFWVSKGKLTEKEALDLYMPVHDLGVMPSMRALMTAGEALDRDNVAGFNCSYLPIDHPKAFDEMMYILMCGTGVGFSVERQYISKLPEVAEEFHDTDTVIHVADSKIGWAKAYRELIAMLFSGQVPKWDVSGVRAAGAPLKTFGGRASGPEPLVDLFQLRLIFSEPLEVEDLAPLSATIYAVKLHRSSLSEGLEEVLSSVLVTSLTIGYVEASQDSGG